MPAPMRLQWWRRMRSSGGQGLEALEAEEPRCLHPGQIGPGRQSNGRWYFCPHQPNRASCASATVVMEVRQAANAAKAAGQARPAWKQTAQTTTKMAVIAATSATPRQVMARPRI